MALGQISIAEFQASYELDQGRLESSELGHGGVGEVFRYRQLSSGRLFAVKRVSCCDAKDNKMFYIDRCIECLPKVKHECILPFYGYCKPSTLEVLLIFEYMEGGDLKALRHKRPLPLHLVCKWVRQVLQALAHLHSSGHFHRDVKPQNVLLTSRSLETANARLADFDTLRPSGGAGLSVLIGTLEYSAPETRESEYNEKADVWSVGCLTYYLLTGKVPFSKFDDEDYKRQILEKEIPDRPLALDFIRKCLIFDPSQRPSARQLLDDPFVGGSDAVSTRLSELFQMQVEACMRLTELLALKSPLDAKSCADSGYRSALDNLELLQVYAHQHREFMPQFQQLQALADRLNRLATELYNSASQ